MKLVEFPLGYGTSVIVEVHEPDGPTRAGAKKKIDQAKETMEEALNKVLPATRSVVEKVRQAGSKPDEIEISFGINLGTAVGAFIASASAEANFSVTMRWTGTSEAIKTSVGKTITWLIRNLADKKLKQKNEEREYLLDKPYYRLSSTSSALRISEIAYEPQHGKNRKKGWKTSLNSNPFLRGSVLSIPHK